MKLTARQRVEAAYWYARRSLLRRSDLYSFYIYNQRDTNGRVTKMPALGGLNLPVDWRALQRARRESLIIHLVLLYAWTVAMNVAIIAQLRIDATWWMPGSFIAPLLGRGDILSAFPWAQTLVWFVGVLTVDAIKRTIVCYRACDRTDLGAEYGSARFARPEDLASPDQAQNLFAPGYDIYGGFDEEELARQRTEFDVMLEHHRRIEARVFQAGTVTLPLASQAIVPSAPALIKPPARSRIAQLLDD